MGLALVALALGATPASELQAALADMGSVPPAAWPSTRYLSLYAVEPAARDEAAAAVSLTLNSVGRAKVIVLPRRVSDTLLRVDLLAFAPELIEYANWSLAWEAMAASDPYWHLRTEVAIKGGTKIVYTDGGWVGLPQAQELRKRTGSTAGILRADWWLANAALPPHYYSLAGIPGTRAAWHKRLLVEDAEVFEAQANRGANLLRSRVTDKLRRISRWPTLHGALWNTYDSAAQRADQDPIRNPGFAVQAEAGEHIAARANGLHEYALFDAAGKRLDEVDPKIAVDDTLSPPVALQPMLSCVRCHNRERAPDSSGLRSFSDDQGKLLQFAGLVGVDPLEVERLASFYARQDRLARELGRDREDYAEAVSLATGGLLPGAAADAVAAMHSDYALAPVTAEIACRELGIDAGDDPLLSLRSLIRSTNDPVIVILLAGGAVQRAQWEASFGGVALAIHAAQEVGK